MIHGIGTDIVRVARMQANWQRYGQRFAYKILAPCEQAAFEIDKRPAHFLAKRFAAKEAMVKALGTGFRNGIKLADIGVTHNAAGKPALTCTGSILALMSALGITESHLSLADEQEYAVAFVILLSPDPRISHAFA
ncbi:MAG: holo-ACP synthase [Pseudomonadota bacterium]